jgi:hypothetical protein
MNTSQKNKQNNKVVIAVALSCLEIITLKAQEEEASTILSSSKEEKHWKNQMI